MNACQLYRFSNRPINMNIPSHIANQKKMGMDTGFFCNHTHFLLAFQSRDSGRRILAHKLQDSQHFQPFLAESLTVVPLRDHTLI